MKARKGEKKTDESDKEMMELAEEKHNKTKGQIFLCAGKGEHM